MSYGKNNVTKGIKFERRIWHELEFYEGLVTRCAGSKPVDLWWHFYGLSIGVECKDSDSLIVDGALNKLREVCLKGGCLGLLVWQDKLYQVHIYLIQGNGLKTLNEFPSFKDLHVHLHKIVKRG